MTATVQRILILGGTKEAAALARKLAQEGHAVTTSLAGRTKEPKPLAGAVRIGGFGGAEGLQHYLEVEKIDLLIDATHPFAEQISKNARAAARNTSVPLEVRTRPPWRETSGDRWTVVPSLADAVEAIPPNARVLLALGSQHIAPFAARKDVHFIVRMVDPPEQPLTIPRYTLVLGRPSSDPIVEGELLKEHQISHIVCRNSGGVGAYAKIEAARALAMPMIMIGRTQR
ncbi:MAG: cobalt-precorrin-6A reductase [Pseudomonadota bacterium]